MPVRLDMQEKTMRKFAVALPHLNAIVLKKIMRNFRLVFGVEI